MARFKKSFKKRSFRGRRKGRKYKHTARPRRISSYGSSRGGIRL